MSGIPIHTESPIAPQKASGVTPQTMSSSEATTSAPTTRTAACSEGYPSARPGAYLPATTQAAHLYSPASAPTPTRAMDSSGGPQPPQPGAVPKPFPITTPAKIDVPPPPKAGEKPMAPEYYAPRHNSPTRAAQSQPYPPEMSIPSPDAAHSGQPPASVTSSFVGPFANPPASSRPVILPQQQPLPTRTVSASRGAESRRSLERPPGYIQNSYAEVESRRSLEHPPGYMQNPYAAEMTPELRFATQFASQQMDGLPAALGYDQDQSRNNSTGGFENEDDSLWNTARKYVRRASERVGEMEEEFWKRVSKE